MRRALGFVAHTIRAVRIAATDERIPRPLRLAAALGILPIPGPVDELVLLVVAIPPALFSIAVHSLMPGARQGRPPPGLHFSYTRRIRR